MLQALENTFGALALALSDDISASIQTDDLVPSEAEAVGHLGHAPGMTITNLSSAISLSHAAAVRLVGRLEDKGLVVRETSSTDARSVILKLSAAGTNLHHKLLHQRQKKLRSALQTLNTQEQKMLGKLSNRVLQKMLRDEDHAFRVCRLCDRPICENCPVEAEMIEREGRES